MRRSILDIFLFLLVIISTAACNNDLPFDLKENPPKLYLVFTTDYYSIFYR